MYSDIVCSVRDLRNRVMSTAANYTNAKML